MAKAPKFAPRKLRAPKPLDNEEFIVECMNYSKYGGLIQAFIIETLRQHSKLIAETPLKEMIKSFGEDPFISAEVWQGCAKELLTKIEARFNPPKENVE